MNNLIEIINSGIEVNLTINSNDLKEFATYLVDHTRIELETTIIEDKQEVYLSPSEVCDFLKIDSTTLWRWEKRGYLNSLRIGGKKRYAKSVIKEKFSNNKSINI